MDGVTLRRAEAHEAAALSALCLRSKAHWGYDRAFVAACRAELAVTPEACRAGRVTVAESDGGVVGVADLVLAGAEAEVSLLFVEPAMIGRGVGRMLWRHMLGEARARGALRLWLASDPDAEGFYRAMGARREGTLPSGSIPGRRLPKLVLDLAPETV